MCDTHRRTYHQTGVCEGVPGSVGFHNERLHNMMMIHLVIFYFPTILRLYLSLTECVERKLTKKKKNVHP